MFTKLFSYAAALAVAFTPSLVHAQPESSYFREAENLDYFCAAYDSGADRNAVLGNYRDMVLDTIPSEFWDLANTSEFDQANLFTLLSHDSAILHRCPRHSDMLGTAEEWYYIFDAINFDAVEQQIIDEGY
jgi:hypothetical protein